MRTPSVVLLVTLVSIVSWASPALAADPVAKPSAEVQTICRDYHQRLRDELKKLEIRLVEDEHAFVRRSHPYPTGVQLFDEYLRSFSEYDHRAASELSEKLGRLEKESAATGSEPVKKAIAAERARLRNDFLRGLNTRLPHNLHGTVSGEELVFIKPIEGHKPKPFTSTSLKLDAKNNLLLEVHYHAESAPFTKHTLKYSLEDGRKTAEAYKFDRDRVYLHPDSHAGTQKRIAEIRAELLTCKHDRAFAEIVPEAAKFQAGSAEPQQP